jgi:four helix bundle protein
MSVRSAKELTVYVMAFRLGTRVFEASPRFPREEGYALTSQIRRSSRSICLNLREAWAKRRYPAQFINKLTDCDGENGETDSALDYAKASGYITDEEHAELVGLCDEIGRMLGAMLRNPEPFLLSPSTCPPDC